MRSWHRDANIVNLELKSPEDANWAIEMRRWDVQSVTAALIKYNIDVDELFYFGDGARNGLLSTETTIWPARLERVVDILIERELKHVLVHPKTYRTATSFLGSERCDPCILMPEDCLFGFNRERAIFRVSPPTRMDRDGVTYLMARIDGLTYEGARAMIHLPKRLLDGRDQGETAVSGYAALAGMIHTQTKVADDLLGTIGKRAVRSWKSGSSIEVDDREWNLLDTLKVEGMTVRQLTERNKLLPITLTRRGGRG